MLEILQQNPYIWALLTIIFFWVLSYAVTALIALIGRAARYTDSDLDDQIIRAVKLPVRYLAVLAGFYLAVGNFSFTFKIKDREYGLADIMFVLIALLLGFTISRLLKVIFVWYGQTGERGRKSQAMFIFVRKLVSVFVYGIAFLIILGQLGIQIGPLIAGLGIAGLAVALGLQAPLSNLFAALFLIMDKSINIRTFCFVYLGSKWPAPLSR